MVLSQHPVAPCSHQLARCAISPPPEPTMWSLTIFYDRMFEGGRPKPKGMPCHFVIEYCSLLIMDTFGHGLMGGFGRKSRLGLCFCPLDLFWMFNLDLSPVGSSLPLGFRVVLHGKPLFWLCGPAPSSTYITPLPFIIAPFIILPTWVQISPLGPHMVGLLFPLPTPWFGLGMIPRRLMQLKRKVKA